MGPYGRGRMRVLGFGRNEEKLAFWEMYNSLVGRAEFLKKWIRKSERRNVNLLMRKYFVWP